MPFEKEKNSLMEMAQHKLETQRINAQDYLDFLSNLANGKCPQCLVPLEIIDFKSEGNSAHYQFHCGHGHHEVMIEEKIQIWEMNKIGLNDGSRNHKKKDKRFHLEVTQGNAPSGDPNLPEGVNLHVKIDRKNNTYDKVVIDRKTGRKTKNQHQLLTDHNQNHG